MVERPSYVIRTKDFSKSIRFYVDGAGFEVLDSQPEADMTLIRVEGLVLLIAGPAVEDLTPYTAESYIVLRQGIGCNSTDLDATRARLEQAGFDDITVEEKPWGDRAMKVPTPEGLTLTYAAAAKRSQDEELSMLASAPDELEKALAGLSDVDLDMKREGEGWTIRQVVHHTADAQARYLVEVTTALTAPGGHYAHSWQGNDIANDRLHYADRPIDAAVMVFRGCSLEIAGLLSLYPEYRDLDYTFRSGVILDDKPLPQPMARTVTDLLSHAFEHIYEIKTIREANDR